MIDSGAGIAPGEPNVRPKRIMKTQSSSKGPIQRFLDIISPRQLSARVDKWIDIKCKNGISELKGDRIIHYRSRWSPPGEVNLADIKTWQIVMNMGFDAIIITKTDGTILDWTDKHNDLIEILKKAHPEKELPWTAE